MVFEIGFQFLLDIFNFCCCRRGGKAQEYYPSADEDPRVPLPHTDSKNRRDQQPFVDKSYLEQRPPHKPSQRIKGSEHRPAESSKRRQDNSPIKAEYLSPDVTNRRPDSRQHQSDYEVSFLLLSGLYWSREVFFNDGGYRRRLENWPLCVQKAERLRVRKTAVLIPHD